MFADLIKAVRAGLREVKHEYKRRRWMRRFHNDPTIPF